MRSDEGVAILISLVLLSIILGVLLAVSVVAGSGCDERSDPTQWTNPDHPAGECGVRCVPYLAKTINGACFCSTEWILPHDSPWRER